MLAGNGLIEGGGRGLAETLRINSTLVSLDPIIIFNINCQNLDNVHCDIAKKTVLKAIF